MFRMGDNQLTNTMTIPKTSNHPIIINSKTPQVFNVHLKTDTSTTGIGGTISSRLLSISKDTKDIYVNKQG